jgi:hypothetical protein
MHKHLIFLLLLLGVSNSSKAQGTKVIGRIIDAETKQAIPYVNIGVFQKNIGTVSDENGKFELKFSGNSIATDSIVFSHVGYQILKFAPIQLDNSIGEIQLYPASTLLQEVSVKPKKTVKKFLGRNGKGLGLMHYNFYTFSEKEVDDRLGKEAGVLLSVKKDCFLNELQMHISSNEFSSLKFRLNLYKVVDGVPTELIMPREVIFEIKEGYVGLFKLDLRSYNLYLRNDMGPVAATIQWVESKKSKPTSKYFSLYSSLSANSSFVFRAKSMANWELSKQDISLGFLSECE